MKAARITAPKIASTRRTQNDKEHQLEQQRLDLKLKLERETTRATTRLTRRATTISDVQRLPPAHNKQQQQNNNNNNSSIVVTTPIATRTRNAKGDNNPPPSTVSKSTQQQQQAKIVAETPPLNKRRNTALIVPETRTCNTTFIKRRQQDINVTEPATKSKMYKQLKAVATTTPAAATPPPTIAASRSRRSIKPNPKYASDDMVTPKYVAALSQESSNKRTVKHLFADDDEDDDNDNDDDEDEDMRDLIEEDNDDELNDVAFNPQLHKSEDDDDISDNEFEQQLIREKVPPKRGRGRPPKSANAALTSGASNASQARNAQATGRGVNQTGRGGGAAGVGITHLQQMRRNMNMAGAAAGSPARSSAAAHIKVMPTVGSKRKLDDANDAVIARKRVASIAVTRSIAPSINGQGAKTTTTGLTKPKMTVGGNSNSSTGGLRIQQTTAGAGKERQTSHYKQQYTQLIRRSPDAVGRSSGSAANALKMQKANESDDVPTFTIVNIEDIINQVDVQISRSSSATNNNTNKTKKMVQSAARNNNNNSSSSSSRKNQSSQQQSTHTTAIGSRNSNTMQRGGGGGATKQQLLVNHHRSKQTPLMVAVGQTKPRPRILNAEIGKKMQPMTKPLMSMGKELCPATDGNDSDDDDDDDDDADDDDDEQEDINNELAEDDITISPPKQAPQQQSSSTTQTRMVRRVQNTKLLTNRRNVLSAATTMNASNNQRQHQQQEQQHHQRQQQQQHKQQQQQKELSTERKLTKLLGDNSDDDVFKKPASLSSSMSQQQQRRYKENAGEDAAAAAAAGATSAATSSAAEPVTAAAAAVSKNSKYFPPETITYCKEDGRIVKKITCYETWHVIGTPKESANKSRQQSTCLDLPLVRLANFAPRIKVPSTKWTSKVTLYKLPQSLIQRQPTMATFTGDLKTFNIPEEERHKYQPSCVLFRRSVIDRTKCRVPFDRAIIFKNKCFYTNIEGKHVNLLGAPEVVNTVKDVELLIDIVDSLSLASDLVEVVPSN
ncbi:GH12180 [Drosophila grimshawi]|uniref:GH12180 n=1 Tax=Drosophila grimshawi TaxID=7222 RepID=B4JJU2_DROGR|nr:GH12180 [Drosophila grimshawi]